MSGPEWESREREARYALTGRYTGSGSSAIKKQWQSRETLLEPVIFVGSGVVAGAADIARLDLKLTEYLGQCVILHFGLTHNNQYFTGEALECL